MRKINGFTVIELTVVIAIIGTLSAIFIGGVQQSRSKARDAQRISDINQIKLAIERFYVNNGHYPTTINGDALDCTYPDANWIPDGADYTWNSGVLSVEPHDPIDTCVSPLAPGNSDTASYIYRSNGKYFGVGALLENSSPYDIQHAGTLWVDGTKLYDDDNLPARSYVVSGS